MKSFEAFLYIKNTAQVKTPVEIFEGQEEQKNAHRQFIKKTDGNWKCD